MCSYGQIAFPFFSSHSFGPFCCIGHVSIVTPLKPSPSLPLWCKTSLELWSECLCPHPHLNPHVVHGGRDFWRWFGLKIGAFGNWIGTFMKECPGSCPPLLTWEDTEDAPFPDPLGPWSSTARNKLLLFPLTSMYCLVIIATMTIPLSSICFLFLFLVNFFMWPYPISPLLSLFPLLLSSSVKVSTFCSCSLCLFFQGFVPLANFQSQIYGAKLGMHTLHLWFPSSLKVSRLHVLFSAIPQAGGVPYIIQGAGIKRILPWHGLPWKSTDPSRTTLQPPVCFPGSPGPSPWWPPQGEQMYSWTCWLPLLLGPCLNYTFQHLAPGVRAPASQPESEQSSFPRGDFWLMRNRCLEGAWQIGTPPLLTHRLIGSKLPPACVKLCKLSEEPGSTASLLGSWRDGEKSPSLGQTALLPSLPQSPLLPWMHQLWSHRLKLCFLEKQESSSNFTFFKKTFFHHSR